MAVAKKAATAGQEYGTVAVDEVRMTMAEWSRIRNAVSKRLRGASSIGEKAAIDTAEALLAEGWVSPDYVNAWIAAESDAEAERLAHQEKLRAEAHANRPAVNLGGGPRLGPDGKFYRG